MKALNLGVAAHITAASSGGQRYNQSSTPEERSSSTNGIWLCQNCAKLVDNDPIRYTEELLRAWKTVHEDRARYAIGKSAPKAVESEQQRKCRKLLEWKNKQVVWVRVVDGQQAATWGTNRPWVPVLAVLTDANEDFVLIKCGGWDKARSIPLDRVRLGWDESYKCLEVCEYE